MGSLQDMAWHGSGSGSELSLWRVV
jgi:hypothetical protein